MPTINHCNIYTLSDPITNEIRYIGQTTTTLEKRLYYHIIESRTNNITRKINWIRSLVKKGLEPKIELLDIGNWSDNEIFWIEQFKACGFNLLNMTSGGDGTPNRIVREESRLKMSKTMTGRKASIETRNKISSSHLGIKCPWLKKKYLLIDKNNIETIILGAVESANFIGCSKSSIHDVVSGKRNSVYGYKIKLL